MCTRLHAIGFPCEMTSATAGFVSRISLATKRTVSCAEGQYRIWRSLAGAEIWLHYPKRRTPPSRSDDAASAPASFDPIDDLMGLSVVHAGISNVTMRLSRTLPTAKDNPLDGICMATLASRRDGDKPIAFTFELLGFARERTARPCTARVQLTGLAQRIWAWPSEARYLASTPARRLIAKGALADIGAGELPDVPLIYRPKPGTLWLLTGEVRRSMRLVNPETREPYYWISVATDRGDIDIVASPDVIDGDISDGHTLQSVVSMTGRVLQRLG